MIHRLLALSLVAATPAVFGQASTVLGKVAEVQGVVTVSDGVTLGVATPGTVIHSGNRFLTASSGAARLTFDNGCVISLKPNETLTVDSNMNCQELLAAVQSVASSQTAAAGTIGGIPTTTLLLVGAIGTAAAVAARQGGAGTIQSAPVSAQ